MDSRDSGHIPAWDGQAKTWRRYTREVSWFVQATPVHKRRHVATKLIARLSGPARLLAMYWSQIQLDCQDGTLRLLQRLAASPLVRRNLPNTAAIMAQYFKFRRHHGEDIATFLVRETLVHEEFTEALSRLAQEQKGISEDQRDFGLPPVIEEDEWWDGWDGWDYEVPERDGDPSEADAPAEPAGDAPPREGGGQARSPAEPVQPRATTGSSPSHATPAPSRSAPTATLPTLPATWEDGAGVDETGMSLADSFILGVLRGWRLLQAASLNHEEKRDILTATSNSLDYHAVARALQTLWDDQMFIPRKGNHHSQYNNNMYHDVAYVEDDDWSDDWSSWASHDWWDAAWTEDWSHHSENDTDNVVDDAMEAHALTPEEQEHVNETMRAEKIAEQLAAEAQRTWADAQRATAALRRDRGFGSSNVSKGKGKDSGCFICGGPHMARECPDRRHPGHYGAKSKGKGKFANAIDYEYDAYAIGKGKGRKGKNKSAMMSDTDVYWLYKGAGKSKGKSTHSMSGNVNLYGLQMMDLNPVVTSSNHPPGTGMLDCGATASAAPDASVQGLISAVLAQDRQAEIVIDRISWPYFRYGSGKWEQALHKVSISSSASGNRKTFHVYSLQDPPGVKEQWFNKDDMLVPVLVGMSHAGQDGVGMAVDLAEGHAINALEENPQPYQLSKNAKGHFLVDLVYFLTEGCSIADGHVSVRIIPPQTSQATMTMEMHTLGTHILRSHPSPTTTSSNRDHRKLLELYHHKLTVNGCAVPAWLSDKLMSTETSAPSASTPLCADHEPNSHDRSAPRKRRASCTPSR